jgi:glutamine synthetase
LASTDTPYEHAAALLPKTLGEALTALRADDTFRAGFVDDYAHMKEAEFERFKRDSVEQADITPCEQKEYLDLF